MPLHSFLLDVKTVVVNINESLEVLAHQDVAQHGVYVGLVPFASASPFEKKKKKKKPLSMVCLPTIIYVFFLKSVHCVHSVLLFAADIFFFYFFLFVIVLYEEKK